MSDRTVQDVFDTFTDNQKNAVYYLIGRILEQVPTGIEEAYRSLNQEQADVAHYLVGEALKNSQKKQSGSITS